VFERLLLVRPREGDSLLRFLRKRSDARQRLPRGVYESWLTYCHNSAGAPARSINISMATSKPVTRRLQPAAPGTILFMCPYFVILLLGLFDFRQNDSSTTSTRPNAATFDAKSDVSVTSPRNAEWGTNLIVLQSNRGELHDLLQSSLRIRFLRYILVCAGLGRQS
jgi:hypothetical protein